MPAAPQEAAPQPKSQKAPELRMMGRVIAVDVLEHCPLKCPHATERRTIHMISLRKNAWWLSVDDVPWLLTRLRDELELSGVPLVLDDGSQGSATAARESDSSAQTADSQGSAGSGGDSESLEPNTGRPTENPIQQWQLEVAQRESTGYCVEWVFGSAEDGHGGA